MKKKNLFTAMVAVAMTMAMSVTAFAAGWEKNDTGWWYATNDAKTEWHHDGWQWVDGNNDGTAECYYFDGNGYILTNTTTPDGYTVNADGAQVENGVVKTQATGQAGAGNEQQTTTTVENGGYNAYGISNTALKMLYQSMEENAAEFGEVVTDYPNTDNGMYFDGGSCIQVDYANGFRVSYPKRGSSEIKYVRPINPTEENDKKLFQYYDASANTIETVEAMFKRAGFPNPSANSLYALETIPGTHAVVQWNMASKSHALPWIAIRINPGYNVDDAHYYCN